MQEKDKPKKKGTLTSIMPRSPVRHYQPPMLHNIATKIVVDDMQFLPKYQDNAAYADLMASHDIQLAAEGTAIVDCGFYMEIPSGYKVVVRSKTSLHVVEWENSHAFEVTVYNPGPSEQEREWGSVFAQMHLEPVYRFDWKL